MMFDDGNFRASPFATSVLDQNNYSRAVEYQINEDTMEVSQVWDYGRTNEVDRLYVDHEGNAEPEPQTGNVLIDFSSVNTSTAQPPAPTVPAPTLCGSPKSLMTQRRNRLRSGGHRVRQYHCSLQRMHRLSRPPHPRSLRTSRHSGRRLVSDLREWSAAPGILGGRRQNLPHSRPSTNLVDWEALGVALESEQQNGNFDFQDLQSGEVPARYYRVVTQ